MDGPYGPGNASLYSEAMVSEHILRALTANPQQMLQKWASGLR